MRMDAKKNYSKKPAPHVAGSSRMPRVLILSSLFPIEPHAKDGNFVFHQMVALQKQNIACTVVVPKPWTPALLRGRFPRHRRPIDCDSFKPMGLEVKNATFFALPGDWLGRLALPSMFRSVWPIIRTAVEAMNANLIHAHGEHCGYVASLAAARLGIESVVTIHGISSNRYGGSSHMHLQIQHGVRTASCVILVGSPLKRHYQFVSGGHDNYVVLTNGFAIPEHPRRSKVPRRRQHRIVAVSNLHEGKGIDLLIRSVAELKKRDLGLELVIVGDGEAFNRLKMLTAELDLASDVIFLGYLPHPEAIAEIKAGDVFCLPSWREACSIVHIEAMALGKVAIGCHSQGPSDYICDGETGYLVQPKNVDDLMRVLFQVLTDRDAIESVGRAAREFASRQLTWDVNVSKLKEIYAAALAKDIARCTDLGGKAKSFDSEQHTVLSEQNK